MAGFVNTFFEERVERLFDLAGLVEKIFSSAGLEYRVVGGLAAYLYMEEREPDAGRLTKDIDLAVRRQDLETIAKAAEPFGLQHRHVGGVDRLVELSTWCLAVKRCAPSILRPHRNSDPIEKSKDFG